MREGLMRGVRVGSLGVLWMGACILPVAGTACSRDEIQPPALGNASPALPVTAAAPRTAGAARPVGAVGENGLVAYKDPVTGALGSRPANVARVVPDPKTAAAVSTAHTGLFEVPSPAGGTMVDLQGRFQSAITVEVTAGGRVVGGDCGGPGTFRRERPRVAQH